MGKNSVISTGIRPSMAEVSNALEKIIKGRAPKPT
jgi:hypothetical protein